jgi:hypothetical protein
VLGEAGNRKDACHSPERDDEVRVLELDVANFGLDHNVPRLFVELIASPSTRSACGHIIRRGTTTWRGSRVPEAASGRIGV